MNRNVKIAMDEEKEYKNLLKDIDRFKKSLIGKKAHENFGQKEIRALKDKYFDLLTHYSLMRNKALDAISGFEEWTENGWRDGKKTANVKIAKELVRLSKELTAGNKEFENFLKKILSDNSIRKKIMESGTGNDKFMLLNIKKREADEQIKEYFNGKIPKGAVYIAEGQQDLYFVDENMNNISEDGTKSSFEEAVIEDLYETSLLIDEYEKMEIKLKKKYNKVMDALNENYRTGEKIVLKDKLIKWFLDKNKKM